MSEDLSGYRVVRDGDLVVNRLWARFGAYGVASEEGIISPAYWVMRVERGAVHPRFLHFLLRSSPYKAEIGRVSKNMPPNGFDIPWNQFKWIRLPDLSLSVQVLIADFLDRETERIDAVVAAKRRMIELLEEERTAKVDHAVSGVSGPVRPASSLGEYINGYPFRPDDPSEDGLPIVRIRQLLDPLAPVDRFNKRIHPKYLLHDGDLVFSWSATLAVRVWDRGPAWLNQHLFRVEPSEGIAPQWLRFALDHATRLFIPWMHGSAMTHITQPMMKQVRVPVPSLAEQEKIATRLEAAVGQQSILGSRLTTQLTLLDEYRQALITAAVTGQLDEATLRGEKPIEETMEAPA